MPMNFVGKEIYFLLYCPDTREKLVMRGIMVEITIDQMRPGFRSWNHPNEQMRYRTDLEIKLIGIEWIIAQDVDDPGNWNINVPKQLTEGDDGNQTT